MNAILLASAGVAILLVGGGVGFWIGRSGIGGNKARIEKAEAELDEYKRSVTEHFGKTASYFQAMGKQYRELYEHMANGAQVLCEPDEAGKQLLFAPGAVAEAEGRPPIDYAEEPIANETADAREPAEEPADEQQSEITVKAESAETDMAEAKDEVREQTLH